MAKNKLDLDDLIKDFQSVALVEYAQRLVR